MRAQLIAFEGSDGAGKATQTDLLANYFEKAGKKVARVSFPRYNLTLGGSLLYEVMKSDRASSFSFSKTDPYVASLLYAMDRKESKEHLEVLIETHDVVIFDRYVESNLLHQGGKFVSESERIHFAKWLFDLEYDVFKLPRPNKIIYLHIPFWLSRKRAQIREDGGGAKLDAVEKDIDYVKQGHEAGMFYAKHFKWSIVDGLVEGRELSVEQIHHRVRCTLGIIDGIY